MTRDDRTHEQRRNRAAAISRAYYGAPVEGVHPAGPIGVAYLVDRVGYPDARSARVAARCWAQAEDEYLRSREEGR